MIEIFWTLTINLERPLLSFQGFIQESFLDNSTRSFQIEEDCPLMVPKPIFMYVLSAHSQLGRPHPASCGPLITRVIICLLGLPGCSLLWYILGNYRDHVFVVSPQVHRNWDACFWTLSMKHKNLTSHKLHLWCIIDCNIISFLGLLTPCLSLCVFLLFSHPCHLDRSQYYYRSDDRNHFIGDPKSMWKVLEMEKFRDQPLQDFTYHTGTQGPE